MTVIHIPLTVRPDELLLVAGSDADDLLLERLAAVLRGDPAVRLTTLLELWEQYEAITEEPGNAIITGRGDKRAA